MAIASKWTDLSAILTRSGYHFAPGERYYGATEPRKAKSCRCEAPGLLLDPDGGEVRCWKCGACPADTATTPS